jgi:aquaporin Z
MLGKVLTELIGTFVFLTVIIRTGDAIAIGIALASVIFMGGAVSGGHFNPAVSFMMYLNKKINFETMMIFVITQCIGGALAFLYYKNF